MKSEPAALSGHVRFELRECPYCGKAVDSASTLEDEVVPPPKLGDLAVCFGCTEIMQFGRERFEKVTAAELAALDWEELNDVAQTQNAIRDYLRTKGN